MITPNVLCGGEHNTCLGSTSVGDLTIFALNINRLRYKLNLLETFLHYLPDSGKPLDIIFLSETFLSSEETQFFNLEGYDSFHFTREDRLGGGIVFYIKKGIKVAHNVVKVCKREIQFMILHLVDLNIKICGIYRPPTSFYSQRNEFLDLLDNFLDKNNNMICVGDINIDLLKPENVDLINLIHSNNYRVINKIDINFFTRRGKTSRTVIDHCYSDLQSEIVLEIEETGFSDHNALVLLVKNINKKLPVSTYTKTYTNYNKISTAMKNQSFENFFDLHNFLINTIKTETKKVTKITKSTYKKPWASKKLEKLCRSRKKYSKLLYRFPQNNFYSEKCEELSFSIKREVYDCKKEYYSHLCDRNIGNSKELWKISKELMYNRRTVLDNMNKIELLVDGKLTDNKKKIADVANKFFVDVGKEKFTEVLLNFEFESRPFCTDEMEMFEPTDEKEMLEILRSLENNKARGIDNISTEFLKTNVKFFSNHLTKFVNESFNKGFFPDSLKHAKVKILFKTGNPAEINNYRPISILSVFSKVYEKIMKKRLVKHLQNNNLIHQSQFGFQKSSNTTSAASGLVNDLICGLNDKKKVACIFVDVKKAFDCLNHEILIKKIYEIGLRGRALALIKDYLNNRKQLVLIEDEQSSNLDVTSGAAQGSVLGPLLFLIYINDLLYLKLNSVGRLFADDAAFIYRANNYDTLKNSMQQDLITLDAYLKSINLEVSAKKNRIYFVQIKKQF